MPWGRLDDSLYDHPKLDLIPVDDRLAAVGLWARALSWCNRFLTDGLVPRDRVAKLDGSTLLADRLVVAGLFDDVPSGYRIHDFLEFNDSRQMVLERRAKEAARKAAYRAAKASPNGTPNGTTGGTDEDATHDVPAGQPAKGPNVSHGLSHRPSRRDSRARNPDPTRPSSSTGIHSRKPVAARDGDGGGDPKLGTRNTVDRDPLLSEIRDAIAAKTSDEDPWS